MCEFATTIFLNLRYIECCKTHNYDNIKSYYYLIH